MNLRLLLSLLLVSISIASISQKPAYVLFDAQGKKIKYQKMIKSISEADILFFGEIHNNPIAHWLQVEVTNELMRERKLMLGAEMIESDDQDELDKYLASELEYDQLEGRARLSFS